MVSVSATHMMTPAMIEGVIAPKLIRQNTCAGLSPATRAVSSSSGFMFAKPAAAARNISG